MGQAVLETKGLVISREANGKLKSIFTIRLADYVDRMADLYDLFREGIEVEILDVNEDGSIALGIKAQKEFELSRAERHAFPRSAEDILGEPSFEIEELTEDQLNDLSETEIERLHEHLAKTRSKVEAVRRRLNQDRDLAHKHGFNQEQSHYNTRLQLIKTEIGTVTDQHNQLQSYLQLVARVRKKKRIESSQANAQTFHNEFYRLAEETLDPMVFEQIREAANKRTS